MLDLSVINVFLTVAEVGSFSEAGRKLNLSQPAISQAIQHLEGQFGVKLFIRLGRSIRLTEAGQLLQGFGQELLTNANRVEEMMHSLQGMVVGEMTIGCSTTSGKYLLPGLIARFRQRYPQLRINVSINNRDTVFKRLMSGDIPLGVSSKILEQSDIEYLELYTDEVILIVPASHLWAKYRHIYPDDLLEAPLILREENAGTREVLFAGLRQHDILSDMLNVVMTLGNAEAIEMAVEEGIGISFVSRLAASRGLELGRIVEVTVEGMPLQRNLYMARNRRFPPTRAQAEFWAFVESETALPHANSQVFS
jgi:LysR family transcriptional regulator, transcriptional activator of the cysJI operon